MIDTALMEKLKVLAKKEKKLKEYKRRLRIKGRVGAKSLTRNGNIRLTVEREGEHYPFIILKSHKERYALAKKLPIGRSVHAEGIPKLKMLICTKLKVLKKGVAEGRQRKLEGF